MITERDLQEAIAECEGQRNPNANTCIKLAAFYTIKNQMFGTQEAYQEPIRGYSGSIPEYTEYDSGTEFSNVIKGKDIFTVLPVIDELVSAVQVLNPRLYNSFLEKVSEA